MRLSDAKLSDQGTLSHNSSKKSHFKQIQYRPIEEEPNVAMAPAASDGISNLKITSVHSTAQPTPGAEEKHILGKTKRARNAKLLQQKNQPRLDFSNYRQMQQNLGVLNSWYIIHSERHNQDHL